MRARYAYTLTIAILSGIVVAFVFDENRTVSVLSFSLRYAVPLILAAMVGIICERSGIINIGIEGQMLMSAFAGFFGAALTGNLILGTMIGIGTGMIMGAFLPPGPSHGRWIRSLRVIINIIATGLTSFFYSQGYVLPAITPKLRIPILADVPLVGPVLFDNGLFTYAALLTAVLLWVLLFRTIWGLRTRSVGEKPGSADTSGINVQRTRFWTSPWQADLRASRARTCPLRLRAPSSED